MRLFRRTTADEAAIPEDLRPYYAGQSNGFRRWLGPVMRIVLLLVLLALLVWAGVSLVNYFANRKDDAKDKNTTSQQAQKEKSADEKAKDDAAKKQAAADKKAADEAAAKKKADEDAKKKQAAAAATPAPTPAAGGAGTETGSGAVAANPPAPTPPSAGAQSLVNTGPGEVIEIIALFVGTTLVATVGHRLFVESTRK